MQKILSIVVAAIMALAIQPAFAADECTSLTMTGHPEYAPISYRSGDRLAGAVPSMIEAIAANLNVPVKSAYTGSWTDAQAAARDGTADIIFGIYFNEERATYLDYVRPAFMVDPVVVMVAKGKAFAYTGRDDLIGKRGVTNEGESYGVDFDAFITERLNVVRSKGTDKAFETLLAGDADYMIVGFYPGIAEAALMGLEDTVEPLSPPLLAADMFVAFSKKSPCLTMMDAVSGAIEAMSTDGRYAAILEDARKAWQSTLPKPSAP